jgi:hypothetical protein
MRSSRDVRRGPPCDSGSARLPPPPHVRQTPASFAPATALGPRPARQPKLLYRLREALREINAFLTHLAVKEKVSASTQAAV